MSDDVDVTALSDEELEKIIQEGNRIPAPAELRAPPKNARGDYEYQPAKDVGSFTGGASGQLRSYALGLGRALGDVDEQTIQEHGTRMQRERGTPMGAFGAGVGNALASVAAPFGPGTSVLGLARNALVGGGMETLSDYGEGKDLGTALVEGGGRGAAGAALGSLAASGVSKLGNLGMKRAGVSGRWTSPPDEAVYDWAKAKGIDLRPGDVAGPGLTRAFENFHPMGYSERLQKQAEQIGTALFEGGKNQVLLGLSRAKTALDDQVQKLWAPVYQVAEQPGVTMVKPSGLRTVLNDMASKYPSMFNKIDNQELRTVLEQVMAARPSQLPSLPFRQVRELQQSIGPEVEKLRLQALQGTITRDEAAMMSRLYGALKGDLTRWGNNGRNQAAYKAYTEANDIYKKDYLPFYQNDVVLKWQSGKYDGHPEQMLSDLLAPAKKTQVDNLSWYGSAVDTDLTGWIETLRLADRATGQLAKGAPEPTVNLGIGAVLAPKLAVARHAGHAATGSPWLTPLYGASAELGPRTARRGLIGGLGLSAQELLGNKQP